MSRGREIGTRGFRWSRKSAIATACFALLLCLSVRFPARAAEESPQGISGNDRSVRVFVNQSVLLDSPEPVKRVAVARPETADVMVVSTKQMLLIGKAAGNTTLVYWNEREVPTTVDVNVEVFLDRVREDLTRIAPGETFEVTAAGDTLVLTGTVSDNVVHSRIVEGAKAHAKGVVDLIKVRKLEQVLLQIRVSEVNRSLAKELGFSFLFEQGDLRGAIAPGGSFTPFFGQLRAEQPSDIGPNASFSDAMNIFVAKPGAFPDFAAFLRILNDRGALKSLAEPNLVVANGAKGSFLVGGEFPVVYNTSAGGSSSFAIEYKEYGIRLGFTPTITPTGEIYLNVFQEVSELDFANAVVLSGFQIPALKSRKAEAGLQLGDGQTFVLAGLIDSKVSKEVSKIPLLGDIPILGTLFRNTRYSTTETELMVIVTPKIVRPLSREEIPILPTERSPAEETSPDLVW